MITVKFLGGAKKSFLVDSLTIDENDLTIQQLLNFLVKKKPKNSINLDINNLLVAVNGIDSSAIDGLFTKLKNNDVVSIIPIIHGGSTTRIQFKISNSYVELFDIKANQKLDINFLDKIRKKFPDLVIQAISSNYILSKSHAEKIITISNMAKENSTLISKKIDTDILLRFADTTQIQDAINKVGIKTGNGFIIITIGKKLTINKLFNYVKPFLNSNPLSKNNQIFLRKKFNISKNQMDAIISLNPLEDLLTEKAAILI
jgi:tRNA threonylcarbamoyladenosine modification (KEOPS) complex Cgi121 subunit/molybdopterin converting factor small subunit